MPCSASAKAWRFENEVSRSFGRTKEATPPRQRAYVHICGSLLLNYALPSDIRIEIKDFSSKGSRILKSDVS